MTKFFVATCEECEMTVPFFTREKRDEWAQAHSTTGHAVLNGVVWR